MYRDLPDVKKVVALLSDSADSGDPHSAYALATWYLRVTNVTKNFKIAIDLLQRAAKANLPSAPYDLAICYEKGEGVEEDLFKAFELRCIPANLSGESGLS